VYEIEDEQKLEEVAKSLETKCLKICKIDLETVAGEEGPWASDNYK